MPKTPTHPKPTGQSNTPRGTSQLFPDVPPDLTPSSLDRASLTEQETRNAAQALAHLQEKMIGVSVELAQGKINLAPLSLNRFALEKIGKALESTRKSLAVKTLVIPE